MTQHNHKHDQLLGLVDYLKLLFIDKDWIFSNEHLIWGGAFDIWGTIDLASLGPICFGVKYGSPR